ncbi:undecaprenyl-diphosphatase [Altererythrobacter atlanticus]|uniref:Phosphatidylglycerophosphatase B n=1 Tax=Croceibacterium atlanticum TaxID=1267766 RepID=A0A0F7KXC5_9SPHN|nr:phosphatase PAP2 family protein [Croceibacterium atlanticum]AKH44334.1 phosphatidylglycerophosphatase B [Croceibacterium atlanticum]MBB5733950.1 undecaprenyl-diphosphatase [Croceibacterium atlanticum]
MTPHGIGGKALAGGVRIANAGKKAYGPDPMTQEPRLPQVSLHNGRYIALACAAMAAWLAALLAGGPASGWDRMVFALLRPQERGWIAEWAYALTWLGDWLVLVPLALAAAGYLWWRGRRAQAWGLLGTVAAVRILVAAQKELFGRPRPDVEHWMAEYSASFPSAHAANSLATLLAIAILLPPTHSARRLAVGIALAICAVVGASRIVLGVHWPSDIIGGWAFATLATIPLWRLRAPKAG